MARTYIPGQDAVGYWYPQAVRNTTPPTDFVTDNTSLKEFCIIQDVTINIPLSQSDITTRCGKGWRQQVGVLAELTVDATILWAPDHVVGGDFPIDDLLVVLEAKGPVAMAFLDGPFAPGAPPTAGLSGTKIEGWYADFSIVDWTQNQPQEEALTLDLSLSATLGTIRSAATGATVERVALPAV